MEGLMHSINVNRKLDSLFFQWISQDETQERCRDLIKLSAQGQLSMSKATDENNGGIDKNSASFNSQQKKLNSTSKTDVTNSTSSQFTPSPPLSPNGKKNAKKKHTLSPLRSPRSPPPRSPKNNSSKNKFSKNSSSPPSSINNTNTTSTIAESQKSENGEQKEQAAHQQQQPERNSMDDFKLDGSSPPTSPTTPPASPPSKSLTKKNTVTKPTDAATNPAAAAPVLPQAVHIPTFYVPKEGGRGRGRPMQRDTFESRKNEINTLFEEYSNGMSHENFVAVTKDLCNLPSFFSTPLHIRVRLLWLEKKQKDVSDGNSDGNDGKKENKISKNNQMKMLNKLKKELLSEDGLVTKEMFIHFWKLEISPYDRFDRFFRLIKRPDRAFIFPSDFDPFLKELLKYHPGLEFLESAPEFQDKYMRTVTARIFYSVDRFHRWRLTSRDIRRSEPNLLAAFDAVDENDDINMVHNYFSYEHFYVLYCKFWELDTDRDFLIDRDDLLRYGGHALTRRAIDRVFEQSGRQFLCSTEGKMGYEDFCFFMLAEEDKSTRASIQYWFNVIDLDSDGVIRPYEMKLFYDEQLHRMECLGHELVPFEDIYCQMCDLVGLKPLANGGTFDEFRLEDFLTGGPDHMQLCGNFFNMLFNLNKFVAFEQRDPFLLKQQRTEGGQLMTLWARFAAIEYARLAMEEEMREQEQVQATANGWSN